MGNREVAFLCSCDVLEVTGCRSEMSGHTAQSSSQGSFTRASPWVGTIGKFLCWRGRRRVEPHSPGGLPSAVHGGVFICVSLRSASLRETSASVELANPESMAARELLALTADYQTWGHCIPASIFPLGRRTLTPGFLPVQPGMVSLRYRNPAAVVPFSYSAACLNQAQPLIPCPIFFTDHKYCFAIYSGTLLLSSSYHKEVSSSKNYCCLVFD